MKTRFKTFQSFLLASLLALATLPAIADTILFDNTNPPPTYSVNAFTISFPFSVADSFTLTQTSTIDDITFVTWTLHGDTVSSVDWEISSFPFECPCYDSGVASGLPHTLIELNPYGYDVLQQSFNASDGYEGTLVLPAGTYYLQLVDAFSADGNPVYWDQSGGPASAEQETLGPTAFSIPRSESFQIDGVAGGPINPPPPPTVPEASTFSFLLLGGFALFGYSFFLSRQTRK
jgi:hypothetical protein